VAPVPTVTTRSSQFLDFLPDGTEDNPIDWTRDENHDEERDIKQEPDDSFREEFLSVPDHAPSSGGFYVLVPTEELEGEEEFTCDV